MLKKNTFLEISRIKLLSNPLFKGFLLQRVDPYQLVSEFGGKKINI